MKKLSLALASTFVIGKLAATLGVFGFDGSTSASAQGDSNSTSGIADRNGLTNETYGYQWISNDGTTDTNIDEATSCTYVVQSSDNSKTIKVRVDFRDDAGARESLTSEAAAVALGRL